MAIKCVRGFFNCQNAERGISANGCQHTCGVSRTWLKWHHECTISSGTKVQWQFTLQCMHCPKGWALLSSFWPNSSLKLVANQVFWGSCGCIGHVCRNGQQWTRWNAAELPWFTKSFCIHNYTLSGENKPTSYSSTPCGSNSKVLRNKSAAPDICTKYLARA